MGATTTKRPVHVVATLGLFGQLDDQVVGDRLAASSLVRVFFLAIVNPRQGR